MIKPQPRFEAKFYYNLSLEGLVPEDHLLRLTTRCPGSSLEPLSPHKLQLRLSNSPAGSCADRLRLQQLTVPQRPLQVRGFFIDLAGSIRTVGAPLTGWVARDMIGSFGRERLAATS